MDKKYGRALDYYVVSIICLIPGILVLSILSEIVIYSYVGRDWDWIHHYMDILLEIFLVSWTIFFSYKEYVELNDEGILVYSCLRPWETGYIFVKWEDIERVGYTQNPIGYLLGSADIHIVRRYSQQETVIKSIFRGTELTSNAFLIQNQLLDDF
ncbi:MAG: hypothetical protein N4Q30_00005 [Neisseriaceae bacterium]|nr:hypothetical protein [Neisseriaceae bacterium]